MAQWRATKAKSTPVSKTKHRKANGTPARMAAPPFQSPGTPSMAPKTLFGKKEQVPFASPANSVFPNKEQAKANPAPAPSVSSMGFGWTKNSLFPNNEQQAKAIPAPSVSNMKAPPIASSSTAGIVASGKTASFDITFQATRHMTPQQRSIVEASNEIKRTALSTERNSCVASLNILSRNSVSLKENDRMVEKVIGNLKDNTLQTNKVEDDIQAMIYSDCTNLLNQFKNIATQSTAPPSQATLMLPSNMGIPAPSAAPPSQATSILPSNMGIPAPFPPKEAAGIVAPFPPTEATGIVAPFPPTEATGIVAAPAAAPSTEGIAPGKSAEAERTIEELFCCFVRFQKLEEDTKKGLSLTKNDVAELMSEIDSVHIRGTKEEQENLRCEKREHLTIPLKTLSEQFNIAIDSANH